MPPAELAARQGLSGKTPLENAEAVRDAFTHFIGETFFSQMLKAMRKSVGKPAYFHGGQAEEIFRSQLDQTLADEMTKASADKLADPLFERQFPRHAAFLKERTNDEHESRLRLEDLEKLRKR